MREHTHKHKKKKNKPQKTWVAKNCRPRPRLRGPPEKPLDFFCSRPFPGIEPRTSGTSGLGTYQLHYRATVPCQPELAKRAQLGVDKVVTSGEHGSLRCLDSLRAHLEGSSRGSGSEPWIPWCVPWITGTLWTEGLVTAGARLFLSYALVSNYHVQVLKIHGIRGLSRVWHFSMNLDRIKYNTIKMLHLFEGES